MPPLTDEKSGIESMQRVCPRLQARKSKPELRLRWCNLHRTYLLARGIAPNTQLVLRVSIGLRTKTWLLKLKDVYGVGRSLKISVSLDPSV